MMNARSLPTYQQFKVLIKKQITIKEKKKECGNSALEEKKQPEAMLSEANQKQMLCA